MCALKCKEREKSLDCSSKWNICKYLQFWANICICVQEVAFLCDILHRRNKNSPQIGFNTKCEKLPVLDSVRVSRPRMAKLTFRQLSICPHNILYYSYHTFSSCEIFSFLLSWENPRSCRNIWKLYISFQSSVQLYIH